MRHLRIGSRGSILARWQAEFVRKQLFQIAGVEAEIVIIKTSGDKMQQAPLTQIGGKGIFIKELEEALLDESVDLAVHSVKDIPTETPSRLFFPAVCRRDDVRDCLVSNSGTVLANLKPGARVGTSSLRRQAQLRHHRPDLDIRELRGNVDTRLRKVESGEYDAIVLSKAGLDRLGWSAKITEPISTEISLPAVGQGAIAIESRVKDQETADVLGRLDDAETRTAIIAERALLSKLQGGCQVPVGAWARYERAELVMDAVVCSVDGKRYVRQKAAAPSEQASQLGDHLAQVLIDSGAREILDEVNRSRG
ncbi:MAG TPA: hydroxymethylbilane synthase [Candidatus Saccharimonadales bacterium]|nr:hydroxymethylbilane synthase [Candidatus Saccharimonadales bacterium]